MKKVGKAKFDPTILIGQKVYAILEWKSMRNLGKNELWILR